jgi:predicted ATPase
VFHAVKGQGALEVEQTYARARELCGQVGETPQLFPVLWGLWRFYLMRAEHQTARELAEQCLSLAQRLQDPALLLEAHLALGGILFLGELIPARASLEQGMAFYNPQQHHALAFHYGQDPGVTALSYTAYSLWPLGYPDQALQRSHEALTLARALSHPLSLAAGLTYAAQIHCWRVEGHAAQERAEAAMALSSEQGFPQFLSLGTIYRGWALAIQGQAEEGIAQIRQGLAVRLAMGVELARPWILAALAEAYGKVDQVEEGLHVLAEALALVDNTGEQMMEAELHRLKGELLLMVSMGDHAEVETCLRHALDVARRQQAKSLELRAAMSLSRLWQRQGKRTEAHEMLAPIYGWFTEGFDTADLQEARALLAALA